MKHSNHYPDIVVPDEIRTLMVQHQGLGDAIICNGLTRWVCNTYVNPVGLFVRDGNYESVKFMYRDIPEDVLQLIRLPKYPPGFDDFSEEFKVAQGWSDRTAGLFLNITMFAHPDFYGPMFDENFYRWFFMDIKEKFNLWEFQRDPSIELLGNPDVTFIHDNPSLGFTINRDLLTPNKMTSHASDYKVENIWSLIDVIEKAKEVHVINSSFLNAIDMAMKPTGKLFWHRLYARNEVSWPTLQLKWQIID